MTTLPKPTRNKGGRPKHENSQLLQRRQEIKEIIQEAGIWNVPHKQLADKWNVHYKTIADDIKSVIKGIPPEDLKETNININIGYRKALKEMQRILATGSNEEKVKAAKAFCEVQHKHDLMLESHGLKAKVADKIEVDAGEIVKALLAQKEKKE